jgi:outer membrane protein OmpA-like peptidoglycan-associated protein
MKKLLIIFSLIFSVVASYSQEVQTETATDTVAKEKSTTDPSFCPHRINVYLGGSMTNNIYNRVPEITTFYSLGSVLELKYAYFFNQNWGISLGVGLSHYAAKAKFNFEGIILDYVDPAFSVNANNPATTYDLIYYSQDLVEKQKIWAIEVPLQANYENKFGGKNGIYVGLGVKGFFPFAAKDIFTGDGEIVTKGWEDYTYALYQDMPNHFGTYPYTGKTVKTKLRCSVDLTADIGGIFALCNKVDLYVGVYSSFGFLDILPKADKKVDFISNAENSEEGFEVNGLMGSNFLQQYNLANASNKDYKAVSEKWHLFQVGLKVGFHIKPCATNEPSMKDLKKKYYEEMAKKANDPIIIKNTEYVYIVPTCPDGYEDDASLSKQEKENIKALADALSKTKILFDLDKDIPKIDDYNDNVNKTIEILKKDKTLALIVEGYTCDLGTEAHNRDLADRRAKAVRQMFINKGVDPSQIQVAAYTYNDPENKRNIPEKAREEHRAAIFRIVKR